MKAALLVGFLAATALAMSRPASALTCAQDVGMFIGRVVETDGSAVTFRVETFEPSRHEFASGSPKPIAGHLVVVHYERYDHEFLHVGRRYSVTVSLTAELNGFFSDVRAGNPCGGGTVNADGSEIDTALVRQPHVRRLFFKVMVGLAGIGLLVAAMAARRGRRQRKNVEEIVRSGS